MNSATKIIPFGCVYSPQLPELLTRLNVSLAISTYQAGKVVLISAEHKDALVSLPRTFSKPMGIDIQGNKMVVACKDEVIVLENSKSLAKHYPNKPETYDSLFLPRTTFHTGRVDIHDVAFGKKGIWAINTSFSCLCLVNGNHNFLPVWKPPFISQLASEDRCHLNGMVLVEGEPRYVTALGTGDTAQSWRDTIVNGGVLIDVKTDAILLDNLPMPHSPMLYKGALYFLLSASGQLVRYDLQTKQTEVVKELDGFCRGLDIVDDYAFVGMSKLRKNSSTFAKLEFSDKATTAGIKIIHLPTKAMVAELSYEASVDEIYEVKLLKGSLRPNILNTTNPIYKRALSIPETTFWAREEPEA